MQKKKNTEEIIQGLFLRTREQSQAVMKTSLGFQEEQSRTVMGTPLGFLPKLSSSSAPVITSVEKKCTCCLLHPIGTKSSLWWSSSLSSSLEPPRIPLLVSDLVRMGVVNPPNLSFQAYSASSKNIDNNKRWHEWVKTMARDKKFERTWRRAGIYDTIVVASVAADIRIDQHAMEALFGFWCSVTNTFVLPWGEVGFTLEDSHVLTNLPLRGSDLHRKLTAEEEELQIRLIVETEKILELNNEARLAGMVTRDIWLEWFMNMEDIDDELRHLGFLTYWLCKDVFPSPKPSQAAAFGLAARLSLGDRIALAPALVANIYRELNAITESLISSQWKKEKRRGGQLKVWAPFGFLQCWVWDRFESLRPNTHGSIPQWSRARIALWSGRYRQTKYDKAMEIFQDERQFTWRPYSHRLSNWVEPEWYNMESHTISIAADGTLAYVYDFLAVISCTSLKGLFGDGQTIFESYHPNRVARQFGFDQAIPGASDACKASNYQESSAVGVQVCLPGITRCGNPRREYVKWWKAYKTSYGEALREYVTPKAATEKAADKVRKKGKEKDKDHVALGLNDEKHTDTRKKRKAKEMTKTHPIIKGGEVGTKLKQLLTTTTTITTRPSAGSSYPFYEKRVLDNGLQLVRDKREASAAVPSVGILGDEDPNTLNIDIDGEDELVMYDGPPPSLRQEDKADTFKEDERILVDELEEFQSLGLMTYRELSPPKIEESNKRLIEKYEEDPYGQEAIDRYPHFFKLIPQHPHYRGLLKGGNVTEEMKRNIFLGQWFMLVSLVGEALRTNDQTDPMEIEQLINKARKLQKSGFDVRHLIARLKFVQKTPPEKSEGDVAAVENRINALSSELRSLEKKRLDERRKSILTTCEEKTEHAIQIMDDKMEEKKRKKTEL